MFLRVGICLKVVDSIWNPMKKGEETKKNPEGRGLPNSTYTGKFLTPKRKYPGVWCGTKCVLWRNRGHGFLAVVYLCSHCWFADSHFPF